MADDGTDDVVADNGVEKERQHDVSVEVNDNVEATQQTTNGPESTEQQQQQQQQLVEDDAESGPPNGQSEDNVATTTNDDNDETPPPCAVPLPTDDDYDDDDDGEKYRQSDKLLGSDDDMATTLQQLTNDMQRLDEQEEDAAISNRYNSNRFIFLLQSCLLGVSYSIIWPTLWLYIRSFHMSHNLTKLLYGITFVAYPLASILSAHMVERTTWSTKTIILSLGVAEIVGNLLYSLPFHPALLVGGRLVAGLGDAFYVILMRDMRSKHGYTNNNNMTMECLAAFITGVILSPGVNLLTSLIPFTVGQWKVSSNNFPGLSTAILFLVMEVIVIVFLPSLNEEETSLRSHASSSSSSLVEGTAVDEGGCRLKVVFISVYSFVYTYTVSYFELTIPLIVFQQCHLSTTSSMILYAVVGTLYALLLMFTMTTNFNNQLEVSISVTVLFTTAALLSVLYLPGSTGVVSVVCLSVVVVTLAVLWSNDDILFINLVRSLVTPTHRDNAHTLRKNISKVAFAVAAVTVPFTFDVSVSVWVVPVLVLLIYCCFSVFVVLRCLDHANKQTTRKD